MHYLDRVYVASQRVQSWHGQIAFHASITHESGCASVGSNRPCNCNPTIEITTGGTAYDVGLDGTPHDKPHVVN